MKITRYWFIVFLALMMSGLSPATAAEEVPPSGVPGVLKTGNFRMPFVKNQGQAGDKTVAYYAQTMGGRVSVARDGRVRYSLPKYEVGRLVDTVVFSEYFGDFTGIDVAGYEKSPARIHRIIGNDPSLWLHNIPAYAQVGLGRIAPGIELRLNATGRNVEKFFFVEPGASVDDIVVEVSGAERLAVAPRGELLVRTEQGDVAFTKPVAYQMIDGEKHFIEASYLIIDSGCGLQYGFDVGSYDGGRTLVIDPLLAATYLGSSDDDSEEVCGIAVSEYGDVFMAGRTSSADFPSTGGGYQTASAGGADAFIIKFNGDLEIVDACTFFGGTGDDAAQAIALDSNGMPWIAGTTDSTDFPTTSLAFNRAHSGGDDVFVATFSSGDLGYLAASTLLGGSNDDAATAIAIGYGNKPYVAGTTESTDFPVTVSAYDSSFNGTPTVGDVFVAHLEWNLSDVLASSFLGGSSYDKPHAIAVTQSDVYVAGYTWSYDFPTTEGAHDQTHNGPADGFAYDGFISRLDGDLQTLHASTFIGGGQYDEVYAVAVAGSLVYAAGYTSSSNFPVTEGSCQTVYADGTDAFVASFDALRLNLENATYLGGEMEDRARSILVDGSGNVYVSGETDSADFPVTQGAYDKTLNYWVPDIFISKLTPEHGSLEASTYLGGSSAEYCIGMAQNTRGDIYVTGETWSDDFPAADRAFQKNRNGSADIFIAKLDSALSGTATTPVASINIALFNFGTVASGGNSPAQSFTITNTGGADLVMQEFTFSTAADEFALTNNACSGETIAPSGSCSFSIVFSPDTPGEKNTTLTITSNAEALSVYLLGTGGSSSEVPVLTVLPASHNFGDATVGSSSATRTFSITNTGDGSLVLGTIELSGTDASEFAIQSDACSSHSLSASESCGFSVIFSPDSEGVKNATLTIPSNVDAVSVALSGTGFTSGGGEPTEVSGDQYDGSGGPWSLSGSPYIVTGNVNVPQGQTLTIEPGVTVLFDGNYGIDVFGALIADGTPEAGIRFSSNADAPARGDWKSIYFEPGGGTSVMDHCTVEYGGSDTDWGWANICVDGVSTVTVANTASRYSADVGLHVKGDASPVVTQCDFSHNGYDAMAVQINSYPVLSDLLAHDNDRWNGIMVEGGDITVSGTWRAAGIPYVINDGGASSGNREIVSGVTLTIMPGTVIKMEDNGTISFTVSGTLISRGSADEPIIFTSVADDAYGGDANADGNATAGEPDDWESVDFAAESTESIVTHTLFRFGGQDDYTIGIFTDGILFEDDTVSYSGADGIKIEGASPGLTRVSVHDSVYDGLWLVDSSAVISSCDSSHNGTSGVGMTADSMPTIHNCILTENGDAGVSAQNGSNPTIDGSVISGNVGYGVINETTSLCVNAQGNWWGDAAGPLDDSDDEGGYYNPDGTGNKVSDHVDYQSWLTAPPGIEAPVLTVLPASHNFGNATVGSSSAARAFTITNTGSGSLVLETIELSGTDASEFAIQSDPCSGHSLSASESCTFAVLFSPDSEGVKNATLTIPSNADAGSVALSGTGVASGGAPAGDINGDAIVNLQDLVIALQIIVRMEPDEIHLTADVNGDERIGMEEAVYIARHVAFPGDVSEEDRELAVQRVTEAMSIIETGDFVAAREKFAEALEADAGNTAAKAGYSLCVVGENAPVFKNVMADLFNSFLANDLSSGFDIIMQMLTLFDKFPFYKLSSMQGETAPQSIVPASDAGYGIDIDLDVPNSLKEIVLRITKGVPVTDTSYFTAIATIKSLLNNYVQQMKLILPLIRGAQQDPTLQFEISTAIFKDMFGYDIDGDGINDVDIPGDKVCIDQGDFYLLDAMLSMIVGIGDVFAAYNFEGDSFDIAGDVNGDGYISPDEYLPPRPYYTLLPGAAEKLTEARNYMTTAVEKATRGIEITLAEAEDYYEILPVNADPGFRSFLSSLKNSDTYVDLNDLQTVIAGVYAFDLSEGPFFLPGQSIRVDAMRFFDNPKDLRDYLPAIRINDGSMIYRNDPTLGGIIPDGDLDDILNYSIGISTLSSIPIIRSLTPVEPVVHGTVAITGEGFGASQGSSAISLANSPVQGEDILSWSDSEITFRVAEDMLSGRLAVTVDGTRSNSRRLSISGMLVDHFDEVASAEMAGAPPTTIDSGLFVYDIYDMASAVSSPSNWKINGGFLKEGSDMYRTGGSLDPNSNLARGSNLVMKGRSFADGTLTVGFGVEQGGLTGTDNDGIGVIFRYQDENNFYRLMSVRDDYWDHGPWTRLEKWVDGSLTVLALSTDPEEVYKSVADDAMKTGDINEFRIETTGNRIRAYLRLFQNGAWGAEKLIFDVEDSRFSSGRIGVSTYAMWWALIDYIAIATP